MKLNTQTLMNITNNKDNFTSVMEYKTKTELW